MERRRRHHPHTRKEWDEICPRFTELYLVERRKLSEVVEILSEQGFHARECHYKTYIKKWGLDKKNKQSEMVFALQKLQERQGKDTVFHLRGRKLTSEDIRHYWKRKRHDPKEFSPIPDTPEGMEYCTPNPSSREESIPAKGQHTIQDSFILAANEPIVHFQDICHQVTSTLRSNSLRHPSSPDPFRALEQALQSARVYCQNFVERATADRSLYSDREDYAALYAFRRTAYDALTAIDYSTSPSNVQAAQVDVLGLIPTIAKTNRPYLMTILLNVIIGCNVNTTSKLHDKKILSYKIMDVIARVLPAAHPVAIILQAIRNSSCDTVAFSENLMSLSRDLIAHDVGSESLETWYLTDCACAVSQIRNDWNAALRHGEELCRISSLLFELTRDDDTLFIKLNSQVLLARTYAEVGNDGKAHVLIESGLQLCQDKNSSTPLSGIRSSLLFFQGRLREQYGEVPAAIDSFSEALTIRLKIFGAGDFLAMRIADWLKHAIEKNERERQYAKDAKEYSLN